MPGAYLAGVYLIRAPAPPEVTGSRRDVVPSQLTLLDPRVGFNAITAVLGADEFEPVRVEAITFTAPVGNAILYLLTFPGAQADFGIAVFGGVLVGAFGAALANRSLRAEAFQGPRHLGRYLPGGVMLGFGGVLSLGCTIGAGLSGLSVLASGSALAVGAKIGGAVLARHWLGGE